MFKRSLKVIGLIFNRGHDQISTGVECSTGNLFLPTTDNNFVDASCFGFACSPKTMAWYASEILQGECHVLKNVAGPGAGLQALQKATAHAWTTAMFDQTGQPRD